MIVRGRVRRPDRRWAERPKRRRAFLTGDRTGGRVRNLSGRVPEWPKGTGCKPVGVSLRRFESFRAQSCFSPTTTPARVVRIFLSSLSSVSAVHCCQCILAARSAASWRHAARAWRQQRPALQASASGPATHCRRSRRCYAVASAGLASRRLPRLPKVFSIKT